jgi:hypothetical protein
MESAMNISLSSAAFGIRYTNHYSIEDKFGRILDRILKTPNWGAERFPLTAEGLGFRALKNDDRQEQITISSTDTVYKGPLGNIEEASKRGTEFAEHVWRAVCDSAGKPAAVRYGCVIYFDLPSHWRPIQTLLSEQDRETSELDLRFGYRLPLEAAMASSQINDYRHVIWQVTSREGRAKASVDFQRVFDPPLESSTKNYIAFTTFLRDALAYCRGSGWNKFRERLGGVSLAA